MGIIEGQTGSAMALCLKKAHLNQKDDGLTLDEREAQAESRFKAIQERVNSRKGGDPYATNKNFIFENIDEGLKSEKP